MKPHKCADYIASIDPGKWACGVAIWSLESNSRLVHASWVRNPWQSEPGQERAQIWGDTGRQVAIRLQQWERFGQVNLVLEIPQVYAEVDEKNKNDLLDLAGVQGALIGALPNSYVEWSPLPKEWKGQVPKEVSERRVDSKLTKTEKDLIEWPAKSFRHNVYDAIHLGIVYLEREGLRDFTKK